MSENDMAYTKEEQEKYDWMRTAEKLRVLSNNRVFEGSKGDGKSHFSFAIIDVVNFLDEQINSNSEIQLSKLLDYFTEHQEYLTSYPTFVRALLDYAKAQIKKYYKEED